MKEEVAGHSVKLLYPSIDDHHSSDGYLYAPIEVLRGVFGNWLKQGADGVETFNWSNAPPAYYAAHGISAMNASAAHEVAYREVGDLATLRGKDRTYVVERRGVFPWSEFSPVALWSIDRSSSLV